MTIDKAFSYLNQVKDKFPNQREKYITFLVVMMDFMRKRIDIVGVIEKAKDLFKGHPSLLLGLNPFLPKCYEIVLNDEDEKTYLMEHVILLLKDHPDLLEQFKGLLGRLSYC
ncbi:hypothetical protein MTR67_018658 [Solanum verrucosum]|uniref:Uncharacterized protein n=1 Tax=Solanum verrucosum TaxID=315347 RepID=A0AAF0QLE0_SOLVR|nr:hypothetical protein MTR67_018658 [Solanum verrucosum]